MTSCVVDIRTWVRVAIRPSFRNIPYGLLALVRRVSKTKTEKEEGEFLLPLIYLGKRKQKKEWKQTELMSEPKIHNHINDSAVISMALKRITSEKAIQMREVGTCIIRYVPLPDSEFRVEELPWKKLVFIGWARIGLFERRTSILAMPGLPSFAGFNITSHAFPTGLFTRALMTEKPSQGQWHGSLLSTIWIFSRQSSPNSPPAVVCEVIFKKHFTICNIAMFIGASARPTGKEVLTEGD